MAAGFQCGFAGIVAGPTATAVVTTNTRVRATMGYLGTLADIVQFPGPVVVGNWVLPAIRCRVQGVPAINATSQGIGYTALGTPGPMAVTTPDQRASGM